MKQIQRGFNAVGGDHGLPAGTLDGKGIRFLRAGKVRENEETGETVCFVGLWVVPVDEPQPFGNCPDCKFYVEEFHSPLPIAQEMERQVLATAIGAGAVDLEGRY